MSQEPKINFEFQKKRISLTTAEYLIGKANTLELKDNIQKVFQGANLKVKDANLLIQSLLSAMIINDDVGEDIINKDLDSATPLDSTANSAILALAKEKSVQPVDDK